MGEVARVYRLLREFHLAVGLFCLPWSLMYGISALQMAHPGLLQATSTPSTTSVTLHPGADADELVAAMRALGARGRPSAIRVTGDEIMVTFARPGLTHVARLDRSVGRGEVVTHRGNLLGVLNRLHHFAGLEGRDGSTRLWGALVVAASAGLLFLGTGGIVLWLPRLKNRRVGLVMVTASALVGGGLLVAIRLQG